MANPQTIHSWGQQVATQLAQLNPKQFGVKNNSGGGWKQFIANNPDKIKRG